MILFFEFVYLLDFLTLIGALVVPSVLYQLSDRKQDIPQDNVPVFYRNRFNRTLSACGVDRRART